MKVTFANRYVDGKTVYEQGKTYRLDGHKARHLLATGKVRVAEENKRASKPVEIKSAEVHKDSANEK